jgi:LDH2 family malate/lactate/ureidoglycolate dehydrogenase
MTTTTRIDAARLIELAAAVYASHGMPESDAHLVADTLVQADLWGHPVATACCASAGTSTF